MSNNWGSKGNSETHKRWGQFSSERTSPGIIRPNVYTLTRGDVFSAQSQSRGELREAHEAMHKLKVEHQSEMQKLYQQLKMTKELEES